MLNRTGSKTSRPVAHGASALKTLNRLAAVAAFMSVGVAHAAPVNLVTNGSFERNGGVGQLARGITSLSNWTVGPVVVTANTPAGTAPFDFIMDGNADSRGFPSAFSPPNIFLWGPRTPASAGGASANGFTTSHDGGSFFGSDGGYATAPISQTISGLTIGELYTLSFEYAGAQFSQYFGATQQSWQVTFGNDVVTTPTLSVASQGFSGWKTYTTSFTATSSSEVLQFLAKGTPVSIQPTTLLDGVSLTASVSAVPEPAPLSLIAFALAGLALQSRGSRSRRP